VRLAQKAGKLLGGDGVDGGRAVVLAALRAVRTDHLIVAVVQIDLVDGGPGHIVDAGAGGDMFDQLGLKNRIRLCLFHRAASSVPRQTAACNRMNLFLSYHSRCGSSIVFSIFSGENSRFRQRKCTR